MNTPVCAALTGLLVAVGMLTAAAPASADNSNSNTNTNNVTQINGGNGSGDEASANESTAWPPTDLSWPPSNVVKAVGGDSGTKNSAAKPIVMPSGQDSPAADAATPIVMTSGQTAPAAPAPDDTTASSTSQTTKPIVPAGGP